MICSSGQGLGACGDVYDDSSFTAAVSMIMFDAWPGASAEQNRNPICGPFCHVPMTATVTHGGKSIQVQIVDRCVGCAEGDIDLTPAAFAALADMSLGRTSVTWQFNNW
ncbi:RlpA-like double-psi beta-barrel-protein domain-containing protein-containing protein [Mycena haematopus]|nr:RlpA-like double-psi beta-barrel-protein domain-containing protein-containing protein [Mycena haematopus]